MTIKLFDGVILEACDVTGVGIYFIDREPARSGGSRPIGRPGQHGCGFSLLRRAHLDRCAESRIDRLRPERIRDRHPVFYSRLDSSVHELMVVDDFDEFQSCSRHSARAGRHALACRRGDSPARPGLDAGSCRTCLEEPNRSVCRAEEPVRLCPAQVPGLPSTTCCSSPSAAMRANGRDRSGICHCGLCSCGVRRQPAPASGREPEGFLPARVRSRPGRQPSRGLDAAQTVAAAPS